MKLNDWLVALKVTHVDMPCRCLVFTFSCGLDCQAWLCVCCWNTSV